MKQAISASETAILSRVIEPERPTFTRSAAQAILRFRFGERDRARMHELAVRNQEGALTAAEREELENYRRVGNLISLMKSKARKSLRNHRGAAR